MKRQTQNILYHLLPAVFWLLAVGGSGVTIFLLPALQEQGWSRLLLFLPALIVLVIFFFIGRIQRHSSSIEECFWMGFLLGIASYWLPTVVFLVLPVWVYLIYQNLFSFRSFLATLIGLATIAIWVFILMHISLINYPLSLGHNLWSWLPTGSFMVAYLASSVARHNLRVR